MVELSDDGVGGRLVARQAPVLGRRVVEDLEFLDVVLVHVALRPGVDQLTFRQQAVRCQ